MIIYVFLIFVYETDSIPNDDLNKHVKKQDADGLQTVSVKYMTELEDWGGA